MHINSHGDIYVISYDRHLYLFDTHKCKYVSIDSLLPQRYRMKLRFRKIMSLNKGYTLVTTDNSSLALRIKDDNFDGEGGIQLTRATAKQKSVKADEKRLFTDSRHRKWFFTNSDGIWMNDGRSTRRLQAEPATPSERTTSSSPFFYEDQNGTIWTIPTGGTFSYYDETSQRLVPYPLHNGETAVACIPLIKRYFVDNQHNIWFSGERNLTLLKFRKHLVRRIPVVVNQEVRALFVDKDGNTWAGDHEGTLAIYDKDGGLKGFMTSSGSLQQQPTAFTTSVYSITQDRKGRMWIGTKFDGLYCLDNGRLRHFTHNAKDKWSLSQNDVYDVMVDGKGRLWVATYGGGINLIYEHDGNFRFANINNIFNRFPKKTFLMTRRITCTHDGVFIVSTNGGIVTFSGNFRSQKKLAFYTSSHRSGDETSLMSNSVLQALVTKEGRIFVNIMGGGLQEIDGKDLLHNNLRFKNVNAVTSDEGLVQSMLEDKYGNIWLVRETTVDKYDMSKNMLYTFSYNDMGYNVEFSEAKPVYSADGRILMACNGCYISFYPSRLVKNSFVPKIVFTSVQYQGEDLSQSILNTPELDVPSNKRSLTIYFSALDYSDNGQIRYAYMLEGSDDKWNYVDEGHSASFNHIPHGHLRLLVRSTNANGVWQDNVRELRIYAHPTFWESWMGWLLYILIGGGLVFLAMYMYTQQQRIKMQTEMDRMRTTFFTNVGHKLRTPLTLIGGPVAEVLKNEKLTEKSHELLDMVRRNCESMLQLVNSMLNYEDNPDTYLVDDINAPFAASEASSDSKGQRGLPSESVAGSNKVSGQIMREPDIKLLVVEDNRDLRLFLFSILSSDYSVIVAENGKEGLEKARNEMPDFIISDVMMPVMDGLTMVHKIKEDTNTSHIPIIILSAKASMSDRLQGLREGIDDYITKPFSATYLKERVANIIARRRSLQQEVLEQLSSTSRLDGRDEKGEEIQGNSEKRKGEIDTSQGSQDDQDSRPKAQSTEYRLKSPEIIDEDKVLMDKLMAYLEENIDNSSLKVEDMASAVNLSRTVFYGKIKSIVGMPPIEFVRHIRLQRAEELIIKSKESFSQIAYAVGFADPKYFSRCFKKETGMLPSEYRAKAKIK